MLTSVYWLICAYSEFDKHFKQERTGTSRTGEVVWCWKNTCLQHKPQVGRFLGNRWSYHDRVWKGSPRKAQSFTREEQARFITLFNTRLNKGYDYMGLEAKQLLVNTVSLQSVFIYIYLWLNFFCDEVVKTLFEERWIFWKQIHKQVIWCVTPALWLLTHWQMAQQEKTMTHPFTQYFDVGCGKAGLMSVVFKAKYFSPALKLSCGVFGHK